jgi:hypothetical protein
MISAAHRPLPDDANSCSPAPSVPIVQTPSTASPLCVSSSLDRSDPFYRLAAVRVLFSRPLLPPRRCACPLLSSSSLLCVSSSLPLLSSCCACPLLSLCLYTILSPTTASPLCVSSSISSHYRLAAVRFLFSLFSLSWRKVIATPHDLGRDSLELPVEERRRAGGRGRPPRCVRENAERGDQ